MARMGMTVTAREGIRELTNEEIAAVAGGIQSFSLCAIEQKIACIIQSIFSCFGHSTPS